MSLSAYLWGIRLFTLLAFIAWVGITLAVDPGQSGWVGRGLFFSSLLAFLTGLCTLGVTGAYRRTVGDAGAAQALGGAFRQAFLIAAGLVGAAGLRFGGLLTWWDSLLVLAAILLVELTFRRLLTDDRIW